MYEAALPGLCFLAFSARLCLHRLSAWRVVAAQLLIPAALALAALVLCGGVRMLVGAGGEPPLMPRWPGPG